MGEHAGGRRGRHEGKDSIVLILLALALIAASAGVIADHRRGDGPRPALAQANTFELPDADYPEVPIESHEPFVLELPEMTPTPVEEAVEAPPPGPRAVSLAPAQPAAPPPPAQAAQPTPVPPTPAPPPPATPTAAPASQFYVPEVSSGPLTAPERQLFDGMNAERARAGLAPLAYDATLTRVGRTRVRQMVDQGYFAHVDPYGYTMYVELLRHFGAGYGHAGENLARNNRPAAQAAGEALSGLMRSPGHRANMLGSSYGRVGIGHAVNGSGMHYFALIFTD